MRHLAGLLFMLCLSVASLVSAGPRDLVGQPAPPIRARALDGDREIGLSDYRGRVVLLTFVATWCGACRRLAPHLDAIARELGPRGLTVVAMTHEPRRLIRAHVARAEPEIPWLQCTGHTAVLYGADALPTLILIDRDGRVRQVFQGAGPSVAPLVRESALELLR